MHPRLIRPLGLALLALLTTLLLIPFLVAAAQPPTSAQEAVARAWQLAQDSGSYRYRASIEQTSYPPPAVTSVGRKPRVDHLELEGALDAPDERMELSIWSPADTSRAGAHTLRMVDGRMEQRTGQGAWEPSEALSFGGVGPRGNPLGFLDGARDIALVGQESRQFDTATGAAVDLSLSYTHYRFTLDGPTLAAALGDQLDKQLRASRKIPQGVSLDLAAAYREMRGTGELWVDQDGLPRRLVLNIEYPPQEGQGRSTATISGDFLAFDRDRLALVSSTLLENPLGWASFRLSNNAPALRQLSINLALSLAALLLVVLWARRWRSRRVYGLTVAAVVLAMLAGPLWRAGDMRAFAAEQELLQAGQERQREQQEGMAEAQAALANGDWDPHRDPLGAAGVVETSRRDVSTKGIGPALALQATTTITDTTDSDGDGLLDDDEEDWGSCPSASASSDYCDGVADPSDSDADGLSDGLEVNSLGTLPDEADSDGDLITDTLEVEGFAYNNTQWYLDPNETDTNSDDLPDGTECAVWADGPSYNPAAICPDTDADGTPDVFDNDNDGDGVEDAVDGSPSTVLSQVFNGDNPLQLTIDNLALDKPVYVDFQIRPTTAAHVSYYGSVLDWPSGDTQGQITRVKETTWATTALTSVQTTDDNAANGDIRLVPLLQIRMPYSAGSYASLPVVDGAPATRSLADDVDAWLDQDALDLYDISVYDSSDTDGELLAYLPLATVADSTSGGEVAFSTRMLYHPSQGSGSVAEWGAAQEVRLVWLVQMLTDDCDDADDADCEDSFTVIQTYYEDWKLASMTVSQEYGTDSAIIYENPAQDDDLTLDSDLWMASWGMASTFLRGRDCDSFDAAQRCVGDDARDVTIANLASSFDSWAGGAGEHSLAVQTESYDHYDLFVSDLTGTRTSELLDTVFTSYKDQTNPTLLFAGEYNSRSTSADAASVSGTAVTLDMDADEIPLVTQVSMRWAPYQYADGAWQNYDTEAYFELLEAQLDDDEFFWPEDDSDDSLDEVEGKKIWAQSYYAALYTGYGAIVETDEELIWTEGDIPEERYEPSWDTSTAKGFTFVGYAYLYTLIYGNTTLWNTFNTARASGLSILSSLGKVKSKYFTAMNHAYKQAFKDYNFESGVLDDAYSPLLANRKTIALGAIMGVTTLALAAGAIVYMVGYANGDAELMSVGSYILNACTVVAVGLYLVNMARTLTLAYKAAGTAAMLTKLSLLWKSPIVKGFKAVGMFGLLLGAVMPWVFLLAFNAKQLWAMITTGRGGSIALALATAYAIASSILTIVMFAVEFIPIIGPFFSMLFLLIYMIDAILVLSGETGIVDRVTLAIAKLFYDADFVITNMDASDRLDVQIVDRTLTSPADGFVVGNSISYAVELTNTLKYDSDYASSDAKKASFKYSVDGGAADHSGELSKGEMADEWQSLSGHKIRLNEQVVSTTALPLANVGTGINRSFDGELYLNEAYLLPFTGCWFGEIDCSTETYGGYSTIDIGAGETLDILPNTLSEFFMLGWNQDGELAFPEQQDQDGDGLINGGEGGVDPDDTSSDADGDILTDPYELASGSDPEDADSDDDGLSDAEELDLLTDPTDEDSDGDGLDDYSETTAGWLISTVQDDGTRLTTRVWSDPNLMDEDDDGLNDLQEFTYAFHPQVTSDASLIDDLVAFDDFEVAETAGPTLLARFEEDADATVFSDSAGSNLDLLCASGTTCPSAGATGRYGSAISLDGVNDYVQVSASLTLTTFTEAIWIYSTSSDTSFHGIMGYDSGTTLRRAPSIYIFQGGRVQIGFGDGSSWLSTSTPSAVVSANTWTHLAATFDGTNYRLYVNGVETSTSSTTVASGKTPYPVSALRVGRIDNYFQGRLDEAVLFDRALSADEVADVMYGRYNPNDLIVTPGDEIRYSATVTNTLAAQGAHGHLTAASTSSDPVIPAPAIALRFEEDDRKTAYSPDSGESEAATCTGTHCPGSEVISGSDRAAVFDGSDDYLALSALAYEDAWAATSISLRVKRTRTGPAWILTTDSSLDYGLNLAFNVNGYVAIGLNGLTGNSYFYGNTAVPLNTWVTLKLVYHEDTLALYQDGVRTFYYDANASGHFKMVVGPGRLGMGLDGSLPLQGSLDDLQLADDSGAVLFNLSFDENNNPSTTSFANGAGADVECASTTTCPTLATGYSGEGLAFDGSDDYLPLTSDVTTNQGGSGGLSFWVKLNALPASGSTYFLLYNTCSGSNYCPRAIIDSSGRVGLGILSGAGSEVVYFDTTSSFTFSGKLGSWVHVSITWDLQSGGSTFKISTLYNGSTTTATASGTTGTYWPLLGSSAGGRFGARNSPTTANAINGTVDEVVLNGALDLDFDFDLGGSFNVEQVNAVSDGRVAACASYLTCPTTISAGKHGAALSFDGGDYLTLNRTIADDFTIAFWMQTTQSGWASDYWDGYGLVDGEVAGWDNDFGVSLGSGGQVLFGTGSASGQHVTVRGGDADDGSWHHVVATRVKSTGAMRLYVDGALVGSGTGTTASLSAPPALRLGSLQTGTNFFQGSLDELLIFPSAVDADGAALLMKTTYPIVAIDDDFSTFSLGALATTTVSGTAEISADASSSRQRFEHEVEAAIELQSTITYPVGDDNYASMPLLMPFEDVPGATEFSNAGYLTGYDDATRMQTPDCHLSCPTAGVRGVAGRAASFDGVTDSIICNWLSVTGFPCGYNDFDVRTVAAWVKADRGTIADFRNNGSGSGMQLDFSRFSVKIANSGGSALSYVTYTLPLDLPEHEWTHVVGVLDTTAKQVSVYVNGALYDSETISWSSTTSTIGSAFPSIGVNRSSSLTNLGSGGDYFHGLMDDLRAYTTALSASQVKALYAESTPIMALPFDADDSADSFVTDTAGSGYVGTLTSPSCNTIALTSLDYSTSATGMSFRLKSTGEVFLSLAQLADFAPASVSFCGQDTLVLEALDAQGNSSSYDSMTIDASSSAGGTVELGTFGCGFDCVTLGYAMGTPTSGNVPLIGDAKIGQKLIFDGSGAVELADAGAVGALTSTFTIMGWINPDDLEGTQQILASGKDVTGGNGFSFGLVDGALQFTTYNAKQYLSGVDVRDGLWQHVAVVFDSAQDARFFLNGAYEQTVAGTSDASANSDDPTYVGGSASTIGNLQELLRGQLDELVVYDRQLTTEEIYSIYLRDLRWYSARSAATLRIDTDAPTIVLKTNSAYRANVPDTLIIATDDESSYVQLLDVGVKKSSASSYSWSSAPRCADAGADTANLSWCPSFDPTTLGGAGTYSIQLRAVDAAGNETTSTYSTIVETTAPTASSSYSQSQQQLSSMAVDNLSWTLALSGTLSDSASGVDSPSVQVALYDSTGALAGTGEPQTATVSGTTWSVSYKFTNSAPSGAYTVKVSAEDNVGNGSSTSVGTLLVDGVEPEMQLAAIMLPSRTISATKTISGTIVEQPAWGGRLAGFHLDDSSAATSFADDADNGMTASCTGTSCPAYTTAGLFGKARTFDGSNDYLRVPYTSTLDLASLTFSAWVKPSSVSGSDLIASRWYSAPGVAGQTAWKLALESGKLRADLSGDCASTSSTLLGGTALSANSWYHVALVVDGVEQQAALYVDGAQVASASSAGLCAASSTPLYLGDGATSAGFHGVLDEITLYERALGATELSMLAQSKVSGVSKAQLMLAPADEMQPFSPALSFDLEDAEGSTSFVDEGSAGLDAGCSPSGTSCPSRAAGWTTPYALSFDGVDDTLVVANSSALEKTALTVSMWIKPGWTPGTLGANTRPVLAGMRSASGTRWSWHLAADLSAISLWNGSTLTSVSNAFTPNTWAHVAMVLESSSWRLYVNGVLKGSASAGLNGGATGHPIYLGSAGGSGEYFKGSLDQVRVYTRALPANDITVLAADWKSATIATANASLSTWSYTIPSTTPDGLYAINLRGSDAYSNTEGIETVWRGIIDMASPTITNVTALRYGSGPTAFTEYKFTARDALLDPDTYVIPCASAYTTYTYHSNMGSTNSMQLTCRNQSSDTAATTLKVYDLVGHATTRAVTPSTASTQKAIAIFSPTGGSTLTAGTAISVTGAAINTDGVQKVDLKVNGALVGTSTFAANTTSTLWSASWTPAISGTNTIQAVMTSNTGGVLTDTITLASKASYTLSVTRAGAGEGTVTSSPAGISCGADCGETYDQGTVVTLSAVAASGSVFAGWSGACSGTESCVVTLSQVTTVVATFKPTYTLSVTKAGDGSGTVTSSPAGISCGADCSETLVQGTTITLTASAESGSSFTGWSGGTCSGTGLCVVTVGANTAVTATFSNIPTATPVTPTATATRTATATDAPTATRTATATDAPTATRTATATDAPTATRTATATDAPTATRTATATGAPTATRTATATDAPTATRTATATDAPTATRTATATDAPTATRTATVSGEPTATRTATASEEPTATATSTAEPTATATRTATATIPPGQRHLSYLPLVVLQASPAATTTEEPARQPGTPSESLAQAYMRLWAR